MEPAWPPVPFNLLTGNPFSYTLCSVSLISMTEAFVTGIDLCDKSNVLFVVEGCRSFSTYIVPRVEDETVYPLYSLLHVAI